MAPTQQQLLDAANTRLLELYQGGAQGWSEGDSRYDLLAIDKLQRNAKDHQSAVNSLNGGLKPALPVNV